MEIVKHPFLINIFIQARMSSSRFPGKVLAPLNNKPLIKYIIESAKKVANVNKIVVLTSLEESDDPLVFYLQRINCEYFRGSLEDVFSRFQSALKKFPCDYFVRLSADSPFMDSKLIDNMLQKAINGNYDIVSNVLIRTFPKGKSVEIIKSKIFKEIDTSVLSNEDREHVFPYFYRNRKAYKLFSLENHQDESSVNMCIDTLQDLERLCLTKV